MTRIESGSPAARAGLRASDVIREIDRPVVASVCDFERLVKRLRPKAGVLLLIARARTTLFLTVSPE